MVFSALTIRWNFLDDRETEFLQQMMGIHLCFRNWSSKHSHFEYFHLKIVPKKKNCYCKHLLPKYLFGQINKWMRSEKMKRLFITTPWKYISASVLKQSHFCQDHIFNQGNKKTFAKIWREYIRRASFSHI